VDSPTGNPPQLRQTDDGVGVWRFAIEAVKVFSKMAEFGKKQ